MSDRLARLHAETNDPEPYPVTDDIIVYPPTRTRHREMGDAEMSLFLLTGLRAQAVDRSTDPAPALPENPSEEQRVEHAVALADWQLQNDSIEGKLAEINDKIAESTADYERAFFGDAYDDIIDFFEDKPALWDKFVADIKSEFLPSAPADGKCPTCGRVEDEEAAERAPKSSTSSTTTGTQ